MKRRDGFKRRGIETHQRGAMTRRSARPLARRLRLSRVFAQHAHL